MEHRSYSRAFTLATLLTVVTSLSAQSGQAQGPGTKTPASVMAKRDAAAPIEKTLIEKGAELSSSPADDKPTLSSSQPATTEMGSALETGNVPWAVKSGAAKSRNAILWARPASTSWHLNLEESKEQSQSSMAERDDKRKRTLRRLTSWRKNSLTRLRR